MSTKFQEDMRQSYENFDTELDDWQGYANRGAEQLREIVTDNAGRSMVVAMAAGLGVGVLIGCALAGSDKSHRWVDRSTAEGLGRRLLDKIEKLVPDTISDRFNV